MISRCSRFVSILLLLALLRMIHALEYDRDNNNDVVGEHDYGGIGMDKLVLGMGLSWFVGGTDGRYHAERTARKLQSKHDEEQQVLFSQYYRDVYTLSQEHQELLSYMEQLQEALENKEARHDIKAILCNYDEIKQQYSHNEAQISRDDFNEYLETYLSTYPGLTETDFPKFGDLDQDGDGFVRFEECIKQMALRVQQAEYDQMYGPSNGTTMNKQIKNETMIQDMHKEMVMRATQKMIR